MSTSIDKVEISKTLHYLTPSPNANLIGYTSHDEEKPSTWKEIGVINTDESNSSIFEKVTYMIRNIRFLYTELGKKAASAHTHPTSDIISGTFAIARIPASSTHRSKDNKGDEYVPTCTLVNTMNNTIEQLKTSVATLSSNVSSLSSTVNNHTTSINSLNTTVSSHTTSINNLTTTVNTHTTDISTLQTTVNEHETKITNLITSSTDYETRISELETTIGDHETRIAALESGEGTWVDITSSISYRSGYVSDVAHYYNATKKLARLVFSSNGDEIDRYFNVISGLRPPLSTIVLKEKTPAGTGLGIVITTSGVVTNTWTTDFSLPYSCNRTYSCE